MRASTIVILAVCLFSVAYANSKDTESANSLDNSNSKVQAAENNNQNLWGDAAAAGAEGEKSTDSKDAKKPKKKRRFPHLPIHHRPRRPRHPRKPKTPKHP